MDASGARLVHGGHQRYRNLETAPYRDRAVPVDLRPVQSPGVRCLPRAFAPRRRLFVGERVEDGDRSAPAKTSAESPDGAAGAGASSLSYPLQTADDPVFGRNGSEQIRSIVSVRP